MNTKAKLDEEEAKEKKLFKLSPDENQAEIRQLARDLSLHSSKAGGYVKCSQYEVDGPPITLQQLLQIAAYWDDGEYFAQLMKHNTTEIDFTRVIEAANIQGSDEVIHILNKMLSRASKVKAEEEDEGVPTSPQMSRASSVDEESDLMGNIE